MQPVAFIAESAADAVAQIRARLGTDAVVVSVRELPATGLARWWQKSRMEILACPGPAEQPAPDEVGALRAEVAALREQVRAPRRPEPDGLATLAEPAPKGGQGRWRVRELLEQSGLLPRYAEMVVDDLRGAHGDEAPASLATELSLARDALAARWRSAPEDAGDGLHVLVGPPGSGKTSCLIKWLSRAVLNEGRIARVWRLDGLTLNTADFLTMHAEVLGVPRDEGGTPADEPGTLGLIDMPGADWRDAAAWRDYAAVVRRLGPVQVHGVVNLAYESAHLAAQVHALSELNPTDLIVTHLDEESRWGKVWNLVLGTNCRIRFFCAGQNVPGTFRRADPQMILARQFPA